MLGRTINVAMGVGVLGVIAALAYLLFKPTPAIAAPAPAAASNRTAPPAHTSAGVAPASGNATGDDSGSTDPGFLNYNSTSGSGATPGSLVNPDGGTLGTGGLDAQTS